MLHWADYVIFVGFLLLSMAIGVYHGCTGGKQRTTQEFLVANRKLMIIPTMLSMMVSYQSAINILGASAEMYVYGSLAWLWGCVGFTLAMILAERIFVPWIYPLKLMSINDYLWRRFKSKVLKGYASVLGVFSGALFMGVAMYAPSIAMEAATGFPTFASIPIMAAVCVIYTALGGIRAVIWTDVFQFFVMIGGMIAILIKGNLVVGGFGQVLEIAESEKRLKWTELSFDPTVRHTIWGFLIGTTLTWSHVYGLTQSSIQRYSSVNSLVGGRLVVLLNIPLVILMMSLVNMTGLTVLAYFSQIGCDPLYSGTLKHPNQVLPYFVRVVFYENTGFNGLFLATLFSGALSSVSSTLAAMSAITWEDWRRPKLGHWSESKAALLNRGLVIIYGVVSCGMAYLVAIMPGPVNQVLAALIGAVLGPQFGIFLLGGLFRWTEWKGALVGGVVSFMVSCWITIGSIGIQGYHPTLPPVSMENCDPPVNVTLPVSSPVHGLSKFYTVSYKWYMVLGVLVTFFVAMPISLVIHKSSPGTLLLWNRHQRTKTSKRVKSTKIPPSPQTKASTRASRYMESIDAMHLTRITIHVSRSAIIRTQKWLCISMSSASLKSIERLYSLTFPRVEYDIVKLQNINSDGDLIRGLGTVSTERWLMTCNHSLHNTHGT